MENSTGVMEREERRYEGEGRAKGERESGENGGQKKKRLKEGRQRRKQKGPSNCFT